MRCRCVVLPASARWLQRAVGVTLLRYIASHALAVAAAPEIACSSSSSSSSSSMQSHALRHGGVGWLLGCEGATLCCAMMMTSIVVVVVVVVVVMSMAPCC